MKVGKIEHGIPTPSRRGSEMHSELLEKLKQLEPGDSIHIELESQERRAKARWAINYAALKGLGKGNYSIRQTKTGSRVWRIFPSKSNKPARSGVIKGDKRAYGEAKRRLLALKSGQSAVFHLGELDERQIGNMAYNGLGKGHFRTHREGDEIRVWRQ